MGKFTKTDANASDPCSEKKNNNNNNNNVNDGNIFKQNKDTPPISTETTTKATTASTGVMMSSSAIAGIISRTMLHPIDTIKARLQVQTNPSAPLPSWTPHSSSHISSVNAQSALYRNSLDAIRKIFQCEGIRGFYKGLGVALFFSGPAQTLYLSSYEMSKQLFSGLQSEKVKSHGNHSNFLIHFCAGFAAEAVSCIVWVPHDVLKERLQVTRDSHLRLWPLIQMIRQDGIRNLYKGYGITLLTFGPYSAVYFLMYEKMKEWMQKYRARQHHESSLLGGDEALKPYDFMFSACAASSIAAVVTNPLDVIKTRYQVQRTNRVIEKSSSGEVYSSVWDGFKKTFKQEGVTSMFTKGLLPRVSYTAANAAVIMSIYEFLMNQMKNNQF